MLEYFLRIPLSSVENGPGLKAGAINVCDEVEAVDEEDSLRVLGVLLSSFILLVHPLLLNLKKIK